MKWIILRRTLCVYIGSKSSCGVDDVNLSHDMSMHIDSNTDALSLRHRKHAVQPTKNPTNQNPGY